MTRRHPQAGRLPGRASALSSVTAALAAAPVTALWLVLAASPAGASEALSEQHGCSNCHLVDKKLVGPAFKAVAERYRGQSDAPARLVAKVAQGGVGVWGAVPMPAMPHVPAEEASALVAWILLR